MTPVKPGNKHMGIPVETKVRQGTVIGPVGFICCRIFCGKQSKFFQSTKSVAETFSLCFFQVFSLKNGLLPRSFNSRVVLKPEVKEQIGAEIREAGCFSQFAPEKNRSSKRKGWCIPSIIFQELLNFQGVVE